MRKKSCISAVVASTLILSSLPTFAANVDLVRDIENESFTLSGIAEPEAVVRALAPVMRNEVHFNGQKYFSDSNDQSLWLRRKKLPDSGKYTSICGWITPRRPANRALVYYYYFVDIFYAVYPLMRATHRLCTVQPSQ